MFNNISLKLRCYLNWFFDSRSVRSHGVCPLFTSCFISFAILRHSLKYLGYFSNGLTELTNITIGQRSWVLTWTRIEVIPLRAGTETVFVCIGEGMGQVLTIDEDATHKRRVDCVPVQILREMSP